MIKYLGSKRTLIPAILSIVNQLPEVNSVMDLFSGTARVGHALKQSGYKVLSNDLNTYAVTLARCYVQSDDKWSEQASSIIQELNSLPGQPGYFTETFCRRSRFFQPHNGARIDAIREWIAARALDPELESILLVSLMEAADRVDSTVGLQMAYLKQWAPRAYNDLALRMPVLLPQPAAGACCAVQHEALEAAALLSADVAYLDPPYNQHKYLGNYHIWESLVRWDKPDVYGVACKRIDVRERKSSFNSKRRALAAFTELAQAVRARHLVVSFNDEGHISREEMESLLQQRGEVLVIEKEYRRFVGARIGIHSPSGERVGEVSHVRNKELIYVVSDDKAVLDLITAG